MDAGWINKVDVPQSDHQRRGAAEQMLHVSLHDGDIFSGQFPFQSDDGLPLVLAFFQSEESHGPLPLEGLSPMAVWREVQSAAARERPPGSSLYRLSGLLKTLNPLQIRCVHDTFSGPESNQATVLHRAENFHFQAEVIRRPAVHCPLHDPPPFPFQLPPLRANHSWNMHSEFHSILDPIAYEKPGLVRVLQVGELSGC